MHQGPGHLVKTGLRVGLSTGVVCALISASDADPGRGISENFPFSHVGAAILCNWTDDDCGFGRVSWVNDPDDSENFQATVGSEDARNVLRFRESPVLDERLATTAAQAARNCLRDCALTLSDIDVIVAAPRSSRARHRRRGREDAYRLASRGTPAPSDTPT